jgi:hypothetical protein
MATDHPWFAAEKHGCCSSALATNSANSARLTASDAAKKAAIDQDLQRQLQLRAAVEADLIRPVRKVGALLLFVPDVENDGEQDAHANTEGEQKRRAPVRTICGGAPGTRRIGRARRLLVDESWTGPADPSLRRTALLSALRAGGAPFSAP